MECGTQASGLGLDIRRDVSRPCDQAEGGAGVAEGVMRAVPIGMIIAGAEMRDAQGGREGNRPRHVGGRSAVAQRANECLKDRLRVLIEHGASERGVLVPGTALRSASPQRLWDGPQCSFGKRHEIDWMTPAVHLLAPDRGREDGHD